MAGNRPDVRSYAEAVSILSRQFEQKVRELSTVRRIGDALAHALERERVYAMILEAAMDGLGAETGVLILLKSGRAAPIAQAVASLPSAERAIPFHPTGRMVERFLKEKRPLILEDLCDRSRFSPDRGRRTGSAMVLPLISGRGGIGVVCLGHSEKDAFRSDQLPAGHLIASQAAMSLENVRLLHELVEMNGSLEEKVLERTRSLQEANRKLLELQDQLVRAETMKIIGQFTTGIGHNLRTPLSVILSTADLIKLHGDGNGKIAGYAEKIAQQGARMAEIIEDLMAKCQKAQKREPEKLNINRILKKELSFMESNLEFKHQVAKECAFDEDLPEIEGFYGDFSQTFVNLINNAVDAMHGNERKLLKIRTYHDRHYVYVDIEDNGCGIPKKDVERIFDFSFTTKARGVDGRAGPSGLGIGLFNSRHLMSRYGAQISVESRPGRTVFTAKIPYQSRER